MESPVLIVLNTASVFTVGVLKHRRLLPLRLEHQSVCQIQMVSPNVHTGYADNASLSVCQIQMASPNVHTGYADNTSFSVCQIQMASPNVHTGYADNTSFSVCQIQMASPNVHTGDADSASLSVCQIQMASPNVHTTHPCLFVRYKWHPQMFTLHILVCSSDTNGIPRCSHWWCGQCILDFWSDLGFASFDCVLQRGFIVVIQACVFFQVQRKLADLKLAPGLSELFDQFIWKYQV